MKMTKTIAKMIDKLTTNEAERNRLAQVVEKDITILKRRKFYRADRMIGGKMRSVLLPILDNYDMEWFLNGQLEIIRLAQVVVSEYENGNTKPVLSI